MLDIYIFILVTIKSLLIRIIPRLLESFAGQNEVYVGIAIVTRGFFFAKVLSTTLGNHAHHELSIVIIVTAYRIHLN